MKCAVGVTTHNVLAGLRIDLLEQTIRSIEKAFPDAVLCLLDNGSTDGTDCLVQNLTTNRWRTTTAAGLWGRTNFTPGMGRNRLGTFMDKVCCDQWGVNYDSKLAGEHFFVWSDDDMLWKDGAQDKLSRFWGATPQEREQIAILGGFLEPVWHWNTPRRTVEAGGVRVLVRDSCPGAAWSFNNLRVVTPLTLSEATFGYDHKTCLRLAKENIPVAQMDLADHLGWDASTHGNEAIRDSKPLDREKWGV
jgi:hypothetical protein